MKAVKGSIDSSVDRPDPNIRFYLLHGPDEGQARALGQRLIDALGASRVLVAAGAVKTDPASLADEAGAMNLFGGPRAIWIEPAGNDIEDGVRALLEGPAPESPVIAIGGGLGGSSALVKLAEGSPLALSFAAWAPEGANAERMVAGLARRFGLKAGPVVGARLASACGNDQAVVAQELEKFALYLDASPHAPKELDHEAFDAVGIDADGDYLRLTDLALSGDLGALGAELSHLPAGGTEAIPALRSLQRRLLALAPTRARIEGGEHLEAVMTSFGKSLFGKRKIVMERMLTRWGAADLARIADRAGRLERDLMLTPAPERESLGEELLAIARKARSRA